MEQRRSVFNDSTDYNGDSPDIAQRFVERICKDVDDGKGFVPFIGAGFSAPSGAPLVWEIEEYLQRCICVSLGIGELPDDSRGMEPWNPRTDQWPPFIDRSRDEKPELWRHELLKKVNVLEEQYKAAIESDSPQKAIILQEKRLLSEAYGAMQDWRTALLFLSRLNRRRRGTSNEHKTNQNVFLDVPQQEVIDACVREVLKDKFPTLGHRMLAALAGAMRIHTILTTNFDDLLERAFEAARNPLQVFEVAVGGRLPDWSAVSIVRSLIKLHGGRSAVRADYSLDENPSEEDKQAFLQYLLSPKGREQYLCSLQPDKDRQVKDFAKVDRFDFQNHLVVIGFSGSDRRIKAFIEYAMQKLSLDFRVYWIGYTDGDVTRMLDFVSEFQKNHKIMAGDLQADDATKSEEMVKSEAQIRLANTEEQYVEAFAKIAADSLYYDGLRKTTVVKITQSGLFLLQVYQSLRHTLPPLGNVFPSTSRLTLPPIEPVWITDELRRVSKNGSITVEEYSSNVRQLLKKFADTSDAQMLLSSNGSKVVVAAQKEGASGITSVVARLFRELELTYTCLWLDMDDISSTDNLFEVLLEAIYYRLGLEEWIPSTTGMAGEISNIKISSTGASKEENNDERFWRPADLSFDGRFQEVDRLLRSTNKHWIVFLNGFETPGANTSDHKDSNDPTQTKGNGWTDLRRKDIDKSSDSSACYDAFRDLLNRLCHHKARLSAVWLCRADEAMAANISELGLGQVMPYDFTENFIDEELIAENALSWASDKNDSLDVQNAKKRFLHAIILMQRPRHLASIWSTALLPFPNSEGLNGAHYAHEPSAWIAKLEYPVKLVRQKPGGMIWVHSPCRQILRRSIKERLSVSEEEEGAIHVELGAWYERVLDASEAPAAAFEAAYHFCQAGVSFISAGQECYNRAADNVDAAAALLLVNSYHIQTHGYSRGSCRRLEQIASIGMTIFKKLGQATGEEECAVRRSIQHLWIVCVELMRAIAREVGEDGKAYVRHGQLRRLMADGATWQDVRTQSKPKSKTQSHEELLSISVGQNQTLRTRKPDSATISFLQNETAESRSKWLRWWRWSGMLGIASRTYAQSEKVFQYILGPFEEQNEYRNRYRINFGADDQGGRIELLRMIEQAVELILLKYSLSARLHRVSGLGEKGRDNRNDKAENLLHAHCLVERGVRLAKKIRDSDKSSGSHHVIAANWSETRLLMHKSAIVSRMKADLCHKSHPLLERKHIEALNVCACDPIGILSDTEAKLRVSDARRMRSELAMIDLHRADAKMVQAENWPVVRLNQKMVTLPELIDWPSVTCDILKNGGAHGIAQASALIADCARFLGRAEPVLRKRRRNVWWTTWYFERKLRTIALSIAASAFDPGTPIPFLGLEAAMRKTETEADRILASSIRMIRVDSYRLASVIDAYMSCIRALNMRVAIDREYNTAHFDDLPLRRCQMLLNLRDACFALENVSSHRNAAYERSEGGFLKEEYIKVDEDVTAYIESVKKRAESVFQEDIASEMLLPKHDSRVVAK